MKKKERPNLYKSTDAKVKVEVVLPKLAGTVYKTPIYAYCIGVVYVRKKPQTDKN